MGNAEIKRLKRERKKSNANDLRKRNSSRRALNKKFKNNSHETVVNFVGTTQFKDKQRESKIEKQRREIQRIKEKRRKEKLNGGKPKKTYSWSHAHDAY